MKILLRSILMALLLSATLSVSHATGQIFMFESPLVGKPAPDFTLPSINGKDLNLTQYRGENPAIVFFWATWCPHCRAQIDELKTKKAQLQEQGIKLLLVDLGEELKDIRSFLEKNQVTFEVVLDKDSSLGEEYGIIGVPTFFFIDVKGNVQAVEHFLPDDYEDILKGKGAKKKEG